MKWSEYKTKRGNECLEAMQTVLNNNDFNAFKHYYEVSRNYTVQSQRAPLYKEFLRQLGKELNNEKN